MSNPRPVPGGGHPSGGNTTNYTHPVSGVVNDYSGDGRPDFGSGSQINNIVQGANGGTAGLPDRYTNSSGSFSEPRNVRDKGSAGNSFEVYHELEYVNTLLDDYESLQGSIAAANKMGVATPNAANRLANLENMLKESRLKLADDLSGLSRQELQIFADTVNANYANNTRAIQRTKEFLLKDLGLRNEGRDAQEKYLRTIFGDIEKNLGQVFDQTRIKRDEGKQARYFNRQGLLGNASARGATLSPGLVDSQRNEDHQYNTLLELMSEAEESATDKAGADRRSTQRAIDKLSEEEKADILSWRENNAGLDTKKGGLDIQRKSDYGDYLLGIARLNAEAEQREKERRLNEQMRRAAEAQRMERFRAEIAQAEAAANMQAWNQAVALNQMNTQRQADAYRTNPGMPTNDMWLHWINQGGNLPHYAPTHVKDWATQNGYRRNWHGQLVKG